MAISTDDFNRVDNVDLGANWTPPTGAVNYTINTNEALSVNGATESAEYHSSTPGPAQYSKVVLGVIETNLNSGHGPSVRMATGARTYYQVMCNTTQILLVRRVAGARTTLGTPFPIGCSSGDVIELDISAAHVLTVLFNGTVAMTFDDSASAITTGRVGIAGEIFDNFGSINSWEGGDFTPAYAPTIQKRRPQSLAMTQRRY